MSKPKMNEIEKFVKWIDEFGIKDEKEVRRRVRKMVKESFWFGWNKEGVNLAKKFGVKLQ